MKNIERLLQKTNRAAIVLRQQKDSKIKAVINDLAKALTANSAAILKANAKDISTEKSGRADRLLLNVERIKNMATSLRKVSKLPNPNGQELLNQTLPNGINLKKITVPLGVVAAIYESRPNVTWDIAALCLRSQNACVLKGSREAENSNKASVKIIQQVLKKHCLPTDLVVLLPSEREVVNQLFTANKYLDVIIPRGSDGLIKYVRDNSRVPVIETGAGVCHVYVEQNADLNKARKIVVNAKVSRPTVCNAMDTLLVDENIATIFLPQVAKDLQTNNVSILADSKSFNILKGYPQMQRAKTADFSKEFLGLQCAIKTVKGIDEALAHIHTYSTKHSEAIVSENKKIVEKFLYEVDAAAVYANASTRFTDGEEFGLGAEIGISTQKLHARGPFALEKLVTEKWLAVGSGQVRE